MIVSRACFELDQPSVIRVTDHRRGAIRLDIVANEVEHRLEPLLIAARNLDAPRSAHRKEQGEELKHEAVIANSTFVVYAVGEHLPVHLFQQPSRAVAYPATRLAKLRQRSPDHKHSDQVGQIVIAWGAV